ncbi:MAG: DUF2851 family protein [Ferruginibacter sp.]
MTERLLQYIWQFQYFNKNGLCTIDDQVLSIIHPGTYNVNQGPDFLNGKIKVGDTLWAGSIELHINTSDWQQHRHSSDKNYKNVILHVVWKNDVRLELFPTLELQPIVSKLLLTKYSALLDNAQFIPCEKQLCNVDLLTVTVWKERLVIERLQQKVSYIDGLLKQNNYHWEETFWWMLARNFGIKINSDVFEKIAQTIPVNILAKHKAQLLQVEAILMGQAGLLDKNFKEDYPIMLQKEYRFLQKKYKFKRVSEPLFFLRMRPSNFPTIRLAQLAVMVHEGKQLFSQVKDIHHLPDVEKLFVVTANDYWHYHYVFDELSAYKKKTTGKQMVDNIIVNTVVPLLFSYGYFNTNEELKNKALDWLRNVTAESNSITNSFRTLGIENASAWDSQALLYLKKEYCGNKRCLQCAIGNEILAPMHERRTGK